MKVITRAKILSRARAALASLAAALAAMPSFAATLTHRWSFNAGDYVDSVGGTANGSTWGYPTFANGQVTFSRVGWGQGSVDLGGPGLTGGGDTTIEIWAKNNALSAAEVMFEYGAPKNNYGGWGGSKQCFAYYWSDENAQGNDIFIVKKGNYTSYSSKSGIMPAAVGTMYHFSFTFKADGNGGTVVKFARRNATTGAVEASGTLTVADWTLSHLESQTPSFSLNISKEPQFKPAANSYNGKTDRYSDSNATYDEVRIWNGVLSDDQLTANASMGPDVYASGFTEGFDLAAGSKFNVPAEGYTASGPVTLGAGSKLRFDTASFNGQRIIFSATGFTVPTGSILDYVELTESSNFNVTLSGNTITVERVTSVSVGPDAVDYFVEWVQPSSPDLYVDTGVRGKVGVKAEVQFIHRENGNYPVLLGSWGGNNKRFNLVMHYGEQGRWEYGNQMNSLGGFPWYGTLTTVEVEVPANGAMSCTWKNTMGGTMNHTMDATGTYGLLDTETTLYLFASHYKDASSDQANQKHRGRLYYCKLWEGDTGAWTLARNFRPCVKDGVAGLYDYVTGEVHYPVSGVAGCALVAGPVAYDRIATWNGGTTPTAEQLATAANWTCTDKNGASVASAVPDRATLVVFPAGIGSVTLPSGYTVPWGAVRAEVSEAHPATQYATYAQSRNNVVVPAYEYTELGAGDVGDLNKIGGAQSAANYQGLQMRHDGWFYVNAAQAGTWTMNQDVDDYFGFYIDGKQVLFNRTYDPGVNNVTCNVTEGWHRFTTIVGDTGGGWGVEYKFGNDYVPFTITVNGSTYIFSDNTTFPKGSGASTITLSADANWSALGKVALQGGARIDLNGHALVVDDILADDYVCTVITNSAAKKSVLYFLGDPLESKAYTAGIIKEIDVKIILAHDGDQIATWTGAVSGDPANANNWLDLAGEPVVPTAAYAVKIAGSNVNLQCPAGTDIACKSFEIGNCTFTANCDWRGLSHTPAIIGAANLNGHVLTLNHLAAVTGSAFSGGAGSAVEFVVDESATVATLSESFVIDNAASLSLSGDAKILLRKKDGGGTLTATQMLLGSALYTELVQTNGTVNLGNTVNKMGDVSGKKGTYTMKDGTLTTGGSSEFVIGANGIGTFNMTGGNATIGNWISVGRYSGGNGTFNMTGGSLTVSRTDRPMWLGGDNGTGTFNFGGTATANFKGIDIGKQNSAKGYLNMDGGTLTVSNGDGFNVGRDAAGTVVQNDGTLNVNNTFRLAWGNGNDTITGSYTLNGGVVNVNADCYFGYGRIATYVQNGGTMNANNGVTLANQASSKATVTLAGGVFKTKFLKKGSGTATATFAGGKIVAKDASNASTFISGIGDVNYAAGGLTVDTAGYNVSMANNSVSAAWGGSALVKQGAGTLTVDALPPVDTVRVEAGTLALGTSADNSTLALANRWSFTDGSLADSVAGVTATTVGSALAYENGKVVMSGDGHDKGSLVLGSNLIHFENATIEIWAQKGTVKNWSRIFEYGPDTSNLVFVPWTYGTTASRSETTIYHDGSTSGTSVRCDNYYNQEGMLHVVVRFATTSDGTSVVTTICRNSDPNAAPKVATFTTPSGWSLAKIAGGQFYLGRSHWNDADANATYDEVRIWNGALSDEAIALSYAKGADATAADIAEIAAVGNTGRILELAGGSTLDLGGNNTLVQPVLTLGGENATLSSGSLVVTKCVNLAAGNAITVSSGASLDLTGAEIVVTGEMPANGCVIATAPSGGIVPDKPRKLTGALDGYWLYLKSGKARIGKHPGVMVIAR